MTAGGALAAILAYGATVGIVGLIAALMERSRARSSSPAVLDHYGKLLNVVIEEPVHGKMKTATGVEEVQVYFTKRSQ